jgi:hypothetical protein
MQAKDIELFGKGYGFRGQGQSRKVNQDRRLNFKIGPPT